MSDTRAELESFMQFAQQQLHEGESDYSVLDLFDLWRQKRDVPEAHDETVAAVQTAIDEFKSGERGRPAGELTAELRRSLRSPTT